jgi:hypothetical protein
VSDIQQRALLRWAFVCREKGDATFDHVRELIPRHCHLDGEHGENVRGEPAWEQAMRNCKRDVDRGKDRRRHFVRAPNGALRLTVRGDQELGPPLISAQEFNKWIRKK